MALLAWRANGSLCNGVMPLTAWRHHLKPVEDLRQLTLQGRHISQRQKGDRKIFVGGQDESD